MRFWVRQVAVEYLARKWYLFLFITVFLFAGIAFGAAAAGEISTDQADHLSAYFNSFLEQVTTSPVSEQVFFRKNIFNSVYIIAAMYILGLTVIGIPMVIVAVFAKGFVIGFTIGFLVREKAVKGFIFALISVLPHNLLIIPAVIVGGVAAMSFSAMLIRRRFQSRTTAGIRSYLGAYTGVMLVLCVVAGAAGLLETYVTPVVIKSVAGYIR
ncbi:stage II sporulation protein M [Phosphitispora fastidiosa]|uniref:stage II sporulation protein M n=1 Tax=Phosphitispora fastidiosa TaxID=2837202 RepID=UPI001E49CBD5|nr:stage II sporulation protein M [Phosphitispora fastidiosa]MBU7007699.1 stage II sporulation protein M [Phosphitispora fastidiosa]